MASSRKSRSREMEVPDEIEGGFVIGEEIGRGSFATVYRGWRRSSPSHQVAIKAVVRSKLTNKLLQNLRDEIDILKRIRHGNVVGLVDCISTEHFIYLVMQYCAQGDLSMYIKHRAPVPPGEARNPEADVGGKSKVEGKGKAPEDRWPHPKDGGLNEWVVRSFLGQLADALSFLRSHDIIHRDIKPQNLLLHPSPPSPSSSSAPSPSSSSSRIPLSSPPTTATDALSAEDDAAGLGTTPPPGVTYLAGSGSQNVDARRHVPEGIPILRVADFGFARVLTPQAGLAETLCGSPLYMAPEILRYEKYDAKADLWSVGAVLYEACVGKPPFRAQNHVELLRRIEKGEDRIVFPDERPVKEGEASPHKVPEDVKSLIRGLLKRNPIERMSFADFFERAGQVSHVGPLRRPTGAGPRRTGSYGTAKSSLDSIRPPSTSALPTPYSPGRPLPQVIRPAPPIPATYKPLSTTDAHQPSQGAFVVGPTRPMGPSLTRQGSKDSRSSGSPHMVTPPSTSVDGSPTASRPPAGQQMRRDPSGGQHRSAGSGTAPTGGQPMTYPGQNAPSPSALPPPVPLNRQQSAGFPAKYVTSTSAQPVPIVEGVKSRDYAVHRPTYPPQSGNPTPGGGPGLDVGVVTVATGRAADMAREPSDDDSALGREYVVIEKQAVEINALVDEVATSPRKPAMMSLTRRVSRGLMQRPNVPGLGSSPASPSPPTPSSAGATGLPSTSFPPRPAEAPSPPSYFFGVGKDRPSPNALQPHSASPREPGFYMAHPRGSNVGFPRSAFARAIILSHQHPYAPTSNEITRRSNSKGAGPRTTDAIEIKLVSELEEYAQKVLAIIVFADEKFARLLPPTPALSTPASHQPSPVQTHVTPTLGAFAPVGAAGIMRRTPSSSNEAMLSSGKVEVLAAEAMALYIKALAFLDKAIRHAAEVSAQRREQNAGFQPGPDLTLAMEWLRTKFNEAFQRADFAKSKADYCAEASTVAEKLIYERALEKSRSAAVNELMGENVLECELEYETALWMLSAILDPTMHDGDEASDEDVETVEKFINSIRARLAALRKKMVNRA